MIGNVPSRRTLRTQAAIRNAFAEILTEKELHKITVQELADRADVGRATFYKHYLDIYDLYEKIESNTLTEIAALVLNTGEEPVEDFFKKLLDYISNNRAVFKMIFSPNITAQLYVKLSGMIEGMFRQVESEKTGRSVDDRRLEFINGYRVQGCMSVISKWAQNDFGDSTEDILKTLLLLDNSITKLLYT